MPLAYRNADVSPAALRNIDSAETRRTVADPTAASDEFLPFAAALRTELDPGSLCEAGADAGIDTHLVWRDRLILDTTGREATPVVKGTWVTVAQVVSFVVDGWSWSDILRTHPELTEADIRACLAYTVAQDTFGEP